MNTDQIQEATDGVWRLYCISHGLKYDPPSNELVEDEVLAIGELT